MRRHANGSVSASEADVEAFAEQWPGANFPDGMRVWAEWDGNGLVDMRVTVHGRGVDPDDEGIDGAALAALVEDMGMYQPKKEEES